MATMQHRRKNARATNGKPARTWDDALLHPAKEWSEREYLLLDRSSEPRLVELNDGYLEFLPMPDMLHQDIVQFLFIALYEYLKLRDIGRAYVAPMPVRLWKRQYREPDVLFLASHRIKDKRKPPEGADLAIEVVSPRGRKRDLSTKRRVYAKAQIPEYWIVDPREKTITVLTLSGKAYKVHGVFKEGDEATSKLLRGFKVAVREVFEAGEGK